MQTYLARVFFLERPEHFVHALYFQEKQHSKNTLFSLFIVFCTFALSTFKIATVFLKELSMYKILRTFEKKEHSLDVCKSKGKGNS